MELGYSSLDIAGDGSTFSTTMVDICVCAEPLEERGLYPCGHALCLNCLLKKRMLMKDTKCPYCRSDARNVAVVSSAKSQFGDANCNFSAGGIKYEDASMKQRLQSILQYPCPECNEAQMHYKALKLHVQEAHNKVLCDICTRHQYIFSDEYVLYSPNKIKEHIKNTHTFCKYCRTYFYGTAEFSSHCKQKHMGCIICERRDPERPLYFENYDQLRNHYHDKHYVCKEPECVANRHIVFGTAMELQKHMIDVHSVLKGPSVGGTAVFDMAHLASDVRNMERSETENDNKSDSNDINDAKFKARLDIVANHDQDKITKINGANGSFLKSLVPVEIFIATYESVLKDAPPSQITLLLKVFMRLYEQVLSVETRRSLTFKLHQREQAEQADYEKRMNDPKQEVEQKGKPDNSKSRGLASTEIQRINWGLNLPRHGGIDKFSELPKLGSPSVKSGGTRKAQSSTWNSTSNGSASNSSMPSVVNGSSSGMSFLPRRDNAAPTVYPSSISQNWSTPSSNTRLGLNPGPVLNTRSDLNTRRTATNSSLQLNNLPRLSKAKKEEKKRVHNVLRVI